jgi:membrane-associated phospholipid phosphatase
MNEESKTISFFKKNNSLVGWIWYLIMLIGAALYVFLFFGVKLHVTQTYLPSPDASEFDMRTMTPTHFVRFICHLVTACLTFMIVVATACIFRFKISKDMRLLENRFWKQGIKTAIIFVASYLTIFFFKHFFGRPFPFSTVMTVDPGYGNGTSIMDELGHYADGQDFTLGQWSRADYYEWWEPNHVLENLKYWFALPPEDNLRNDNWWNMDFPSGHTTAATIIATMNLLFFYDGRTKKLRWWEKGSIIISVLAVISMAFAMVCYRFHWVTDVAFSFFMAILWWMMAEYIVSKKWTQWYFRNRSKKYREKYNTATYKVIKDEKATFVIFEVEIMNEKIEAYRRRATEKLTIERICHNFSRKWKVNKLERVQN